jgi:hypothetical protein
MRTTISLDQDVLEKARKAAGRLRVPFKTIVNEALRVGLEQVSKPAEKRPYRTIPHEMGLKDGFNADNVQELLAHAEGEDFR